MFKKILIGLLLSQACWQPVGWLAEASVLPDTQGALQQERGGRAPAAVSRQKPAALKPGDCIGILAPACNVGDRDIVRAIDWLHQLGYRTKLAPSASAVWGYLAGSDSQRAADVNAFFADDGVQAILCLRGGYGAMRMLDRLDYTMIAQHPKFFIGYSDITALHTALGQRSGLVTIHGPMLTNFLQGGGSYTAAQLVQGLTNTQAPGAVVRPDGKPLQTVVPGRSEGILVGGNLSLLSAMVGTPFALDGRGKLLFIEEIGEPVYRIDRMLQQLWQSGLLQQVNGIVYGDFYQCGEDEDDGIGDFPLEDILAYYGRLAGVPVIRGVPAGHAPDHMFLPLGVHAVLAAGADGKASLTLDEAYAR